MKKDSTLAAILLLQAASEAVRQAGRIPSGHLYAMLMQAGCTLEVYEKIIELLTSGDKPVVEKKGDELVWNLR